MKGLPALAGSGLAVMPQVGWQALTCTLVVPVTPPETALTSYVPGVGAPVKVNLKAPFVSLSLTSSLPFTYSFTSLSDGGFFTVTAYSTGWVTQVSLAPATETTGGSSTFLGAHCGSAVSLPSASTQKLLQAFGVTRRYRTHFEENSKPNASMGLAPAQSTSFIA